jgi:hypothetical protein
MPQSVYLISQRRMNKAVSSQRGVRRATRNVADDIADVARGRLAPHRKTGQAHIEVSQGKVDAFVSLVDPAALSIEFGHYLGSEELGTNRRFVRGLHLFMGYYHDGLI